MEVTRPVMRYYGGKWRLAPAILALMPEHSVYVEPFGGAASVLLRKARVPCEVYNDAYGDVVNVFAMLRDRGRELRRSLALTPYSRDEYVAAYQRTDDPLEAARRFVYRSTAGIGSNSSVKLNGFRTSMADCKHVTASSWRNLPAALRAVSRRLQGVIVENRDACQVMRQYDAVHTLHYVDPPYLGSTRNDQTKGYAHEMKGEAEHEALLNVLWGLKGKVILSGYAHESYDRQLSGWLKVPLKRGRNQLNAPTAECLWLNFEPRGELL